MPFYQRLCILTSQHKLFHRDSEMKCGVIQQNAGVMWQCTAWCQCCFVLNGIHCAADKFERMVAAKRYFIDGDANALKPFPGGSEPGS